MAQAATRGAAAEYAVVVNDEEQYSIWPAGLPLPPGWYEVGFRGAERDCLERVAGLWQDLCPRSARPAARGRD